MWTLALLCLRLEDHLTGEHKADAAKRLQQVLDTCDDWIVLNNTLETLGHWAQDDPALRRWLRPRAERLKGDKRKSVQKRAQRVLAALA